MPDRETDLIGLFVRDLDQIELPARARWQPMARKESAAFMVTRFALTAGAVIAVLALATILGLGLRDRQQAATTPAPSASFAPTPKPSPSAAATPSPAATATAAPSGAITGKLEYPSEFIPPLTVYAVSVSDPHVVFSVDTPRYPLPENTPSQPSYTISGVAPGTYYVYAFRADQFTGIDVPAVYSRFTVDCIQPSEDSQKAIPSSCPRDHSLVAVTVQPGETVRRIDMSDWACNLPGSTCPSRPR